MLEKASRAQTVRVRRWASGFLAVLLIIVAVSVFLAVPVTAVAVLTPYSSVPVADADLDGNPATGAWSDAVVATTPLENGEAGAYGSATMYAKHDGTTAYFRLDGSVDVPWTSATGNRFWLGFMVSTGTGGHHGGGTWDGWYFGLWNGAEYTPQPTYPPTVVDVNGFARPSLQDATQNAVGTMRFSGTAAPYGFTAEWKRALATGDASDIGFTADGVATEKRRRYLLGHHEEIGRWCFRYQVTCRHVPERNIILLTVFNYRRKVDLEKPQFTSRAESQAEAE